jgi:hyperosmotically inducible periplasmic protein
MKRGLKIFVSLFVFGLFALGANAQATSAGRYDSAIQAKVVQELAKKPQFQNVQASTEDGIVTLTGTVDVYQQKLDAAKKIRKKDQVQGVRNLVEVAGKNVPDSQLEAQLDRKLYYDRIGYDNLFNFVNVSVKDGVTTLTGETRSDVGRDSAVALVNTMPGVKDVVDNIKVAPVSGFDDDIRLRATRAIYRDPVLSRYAIDPALPIRILVDNGKLTLFGTVASKMDKDVAGIRANQVFGVFSVQNNLQVAKES